MKGQEQEGFPTGLTCGYLLPLRTVQKKLPGKVEGAHKTFPACKKEKKEKE